MPRKVERTAPGSKLKWRITYDTGAKKWTNDYPRDDEGSWKEDRKLYKDLRVKRGIERIEKAVTDYADGGEDKPILMAVELLEQYIGRDDAKTVVRDIFNAVEGKGDKIEEGVGIAKTHVNRERKTASGESSMKAIVFKPPTPVSNPSRLPSVFLAGSIDMGSPSVPDWQAEITESLEDVPCVIMNPRRENWDSSWVQSIDNPEFKEQVEWELKGLEDATLVALCLTKDSKAPISLLELGLHATDGKMLVFCPDGFYRKGNVDIVCERHGVLVEEDFDDFVQSVKAVMLDAGQQKQRKGISASDRVARRMMARRFVAALHYYDSPHLEIPQFPMQAERERSVSMSRAEKIAQRITADYGDVDWSFNVSSFFQPIDGMGMTPEQVKMAQLILSKVLDWSGGEMMQMIRKNIKGNPGLMRAVEDAGLKMLR